MTVALPRPRLTADLRMLLLAYAGFIVLGMIAGLIGAAGINIMAEFRLPYETVNVALAVNTAGYLTASFVNGAVIKRIGYGWLFLVGGLITAAGVGLLTVSPAWLVFLAATLVVGVGTGMYDAGFNNYLAAFYSTRAMNWLHACFGIGVTISPLLVARVLANDVSWRAAYGAVFAFAAMLAVVLVIARVHWKRSRSAADHALEKSRELAPEKATELPVGGDAVGMANSTPPPASPTHAPILQTLRLPIVWLCIGLPFLFAGLESTPGTHARTLFESRGVLPAQAAELLSVYWGSFTVGRILFGMIMPVLVRLLGSTNNVLRAVMIGAVAGGLLLWWSPAAEVGFIGLILLGFAQAPLFPVVVSAIGGYVGAAHAENTIGFQLAGAGLGITILPTIGGLLMTRSSPELLAPFCVLVAVLMFALYETLLATARANAARAQKGVGREAAAGLSGAD